MNDISLEERLNLASYNGQLEIVNKLLISIRQGLDRDPNESYSLSWDEILEKDERISDICESALGHAASNGQLETMRRLKMEIDENSFFYKL